MRRVRVLSAVLALGVWGALGAAPPFPEPESDSTAAVTPVVAVPSTSPVPVKATDGRYHLVYELFVTNSQRLPATLDSVEAVDADRSERVLDSLAGPELAARFRPVGGRVGPHAVLEPSQTGIVFLDASARDRESLPSRLLHRIHLTYPESPKPGFVPADVTETVGAVEVAARPAAVVAAPLSGPDWVDANGCCSTVTSHRNVVVALNDAFHVPERFAIDFVQADDSGRLYTGDPSELSNWKGYGATVHAVVEGTVVAAVDGFPEQVPLQPATGIDLASIGGNHVVEKFEQHGFTYYAFYAHLQTGSITALGLHPGQHLDAGQNVGLLGNTGNTDAPHLHFHVMDGPDPLASNGVPYEFADFTLSGRIASDAAFDDSLERGAPLALAPHTPTGPRHEELPLSLDLLGFPDQPPCPPRQGEVAGGLPAGQRHGSAGGA